MGAELRAPALAGAGAASFVFDQNVAASTWTIEHDLGYFPAVTIVDSLGREFIGQVQHADVNNLTVTFASAVTGQALLS